MEEKILRKVALVYLRRKGMKAPFTRGAGPDLVCDGRAFEIKGSEADLNKAFAQFAEYVFSSRYSGLTIIIPVDILSSRNVLKLHYLSEMVYRKTSRPIEVLMVKGQNGDNDSDWRGFYILRFDDGRKVLMFVLESFIEHYCFPETHRLRPSFRQLMKEFEESLPRAVSYCMRPYSEWVGWFPSTYEEEFGEEWSYT